MNCPCPIDHKIVEAVNTWAQTFNPTERQKNWSAVVDLMNRKVFETQLALMPRREANAGEAQQQTPNAQRPTSNAQCKIIEAKQPPY